MRMVCLSVCAVNGSQTMRAMIVLVMAVWPAICSLASGQEYDPTHLTITNTSNDVVLIHIRTASTDETKGQWQGPTEIPGGQSVEIQLPKSPPYELVIRQKDGVSYKSAPFDVGQWHSQFKASKGKQTEWSFGAVKGKWINGDFVQEDKKQFKLTATAEKGIPRVATAIQYDPPREPK